MIMITTFSAIIRNYSIVLFQIINIIVTVNFLTPKRKTLSFFGFKDMTIEQAAREINIFYHLFNSKFVDKTVDSRSNHSSTLESNLNTLNNLNIITNLESINDFYNDETSSSHLLSLLTSIHYHV